MLSHFLSPCISGKVVIIFCCSHCSLIEWLPPYSWAFDFQLGALMVVACCIQCDFGFSGSQFQLLPTKGCKIEATDCTSLLLRCFSASQAKISEHHRLSVCCHSLEFVRCHFVSHLLLSAVLAIYGLRQLNLPGAVLKTVGFASSCRSLADSLLEGNWLGPYTWIDLTLLSVVCQAVCQLFLILIDSLSLELVRICGTLLVTNLVSEMVYVPGSHWGKS